MVGWLVNDKLTAIEGTRTFWHHLIESVPGLIEKTAPYPILASHIEEEATLKAPDYIIRNAAYFRWLNVECPVVAFVQDILDGFQRDVLIESCAASRIVVFNSEYTKMMYPELDNTYNKVIPIGTDENLFKPTEPEDGIPDGAVLWVGSSHPVKGFKLACKLATESPRPWVFVMKDDAPVDCASVILRRISQDRLARVASACSVGVCTSREETQHLAGIEMGMCGLPMVATNVGVYSGRLNGEWGYVSLGDWHNDIEAAAALEGFKVARYWRREGFGLAECMMSWRRLVKELETVHVDG